MYSLKKHLQKSELLTFTMQFYSQHKYLMISSRLLSGITQFPIETFCFSIVP